MHRRHAFRLTWTLASAALGLAAPGCAHHPEARSAKEAPQASGLRYTMQVDATRLTRGTGLPPVTAVGQLVEDNLLRFFRLVPDPPPGTATRRELLAEAPAPGYGVRILIEARPDDYCVVGMEAVALRDGVVGARPSLVPYSIHYALGAIRNALSSLRTVTLPVLAPARFDELRKQAAELAARGEDTPIDDHTFARTPRPLERPDEPARYYAPAAGGSLRREQ
ncbi:MAG TPA: hypothetical protein VMT18_04240 [Planctomycetota bacterium]|nr:hypothetical protein [Planctomycetota bacterium]